jgi:flagellar biosynthesis component FlhA
MIQEDRAEAFQVLLKKLHEESSINIEGLIPKIKQTHGKRIRKWLKWRLEDLMNIVECWAPIAEKEEDWEDIFANLEYKLQKHISERIGKKPGKGVPYKGKRKENCYNG